MDINGSHVGPDESPLGLKLSLYAALGSADSAVANSLYETSCALFQHEAERRMSHAPLGCAVLPVDEEALSLPISSILVRPAVIDMCGPSIR